MTTPPEFQAPGPGQWTLDRSHFPGGTTPILQWLMTECMATGMERVFAEIGVPARRIEARFVHGFMYTRLMPLIGADKPPVRLPPVPILKLATRLHPAFRARTKRAATALEDRRFLDVVADWESTIRPGLIARNRAAQEFDISIADDVELQTHITGLLDQLLETTELHFYLHGHDMGPIARYLHSAIAWGLDPTAASSALAGASPTTSRPLGRLVELRRMIDDSGRDVTSLHEVRAVSAEAAALLDQYLDDHGSVLATGYDITSFTLAELPGVLLGGIRSAVAPDAEDTDAVVSDLRARVPAGGRVDFDRFLADARAVMDMRDDNGPLTVEWPTGLLRMALLEAGRRLVDRGDFHEAEHALDLTPVEARDVFGTGCPSAAEIERRSVERISRQQLDPPPLLGPDEPEPPLDAMPKPLAELVAMVQTALTHLGMDGTTPTDPLVGVGIGHEAYTGRVRTAGTADEAIEKLEPGDVLVVRATSPSFNAVLTIAGAVVTANGGALSHAAVLARELGIPAVVGVSGALDIADGSTITVDPVAGRVRVS